MGPEDLHQISVKLNKQKHPYIKKDKITYITEEVGYWRKANAIHKWFVDNCQNGVDDCRGSYVGYDQLKDLLTICKEIQSNHYRAPELLPTQAGFFFGDTSYNEWYFNDIDKTIKILEPLVELNDKLKRSSDSVNFYPIYEYHSSW